MSSQVTADKQNITILVAKPVHVTFGENHPYQKFISLRQGSTCTSLINGPFLTTLNYSVSSRHSLIVLSKKTIISCQSNTILSLASQTSSIPLIVYTRELLPVLLSVSKQVFRVGKTEICSFLFRCHAFSFIIQYNVSKSILQ